MAKLKVFLSYSHKDETSKEELDEHLSSLKRNEIIDVWNDRKIVAGTGWEKDIFENLREADLILCLLSSSFLASNFCMEKEFKIAIERHKKGEAIIIPIIIRPCDWMTDMGNIQATPKDGLAIAKWDDKDDAYMNVVNSIKTTISYILDKKEEKINLEQKATESEILKVVGHINKDMLERPHKSVLTGDLNYIPNGYQIWLFKKPSTMNNYHPEDGPLLIKRNSWENNLHLGNEKPFTHQGEKFQLILCIVTDERGKELSKYLYDQNNRQLWPGLDDMKAVRVLDIIEVTRKDK